MSEYQHYEFRAIDRPLTVAQQAELRQLSTRAEITAHHLKNVYHFGDFKGNLAALMRDYFDAFLYYANWGTHRLAFRLPGGILDTDVASAYADGERLKIEPAADKVVVWFEAHIEAPDWDEVVANLDELLPLREELLAGDLRPLYLGWLARVEHDFFEGDEPFPEPPVPPGLGDLSAAQKALAEFLWLDDHLVTAAASASPPAPARPGDQDFGRWLRGLSAGDKDRWLVRLAGDDTPAARGELLRLFRQATTGRVPGTTTGRTALDLWSRVRELEEEEKRRQAQEKQRRRDAELNALARRGEAAWREVDRLLATKQSRSYDEAVVLLRELRDLASRDGTQEPFASRVANIRQQHARKPSLMERLDKAGLR